MNPVENRTVDWHTRALRSSRAVEGQARRDRGNRSTRCQCLIDEMPETNRRRRSRALEREVRMTDDRHLPDGFVGRVASRFLTLNGAFKTQSGDTLEEVTLAYEIYGEIDDSASNVILVFHAITGSQHAAGINPQVPDVGGRWTPEQHIGWWDGFIGSGRAIDTDRYAVLCVNYLGGCYGSTGPASKAAW